MRQAYECSRFKPTVSSFGSAIDFITEKLDTTHAKIKKEIVKQRNCQIAQLARQIASSIPINLESANFFTQPPLKRRCDEGEQMRKPLVGGTKVVADSTILTIPEPTKTAPAVHLSYSPKCEARIH